MIHIPENLKRAHGGSVEKAGDIMRSLGFRDDADNELKKTLLRSMAKFANDAETRRRFSQSKTGEQLSFAFEESSDSKQAITSTLTSSTG